MLYRTSFFYLFLTTANLLFSSDNLQYLKTAFTEADRYQPEKVADDPFFRTSLEVFREAIPDLGAFSQTYTYMIVKPDALVFADLRKIVDVIEEFGFQIVAYDSFQYSSNSVKAFWFHESRPFPPGWFKMFDLVLTHHPSLVLLLKRTHEEKISACEEISQYKGHALAAKRKPTSIRALIGAQDGPFGFIHTPDNPLAMIRELGIIIDEVHLLNLLKRGLEGIPCPSEMLQTFQQPPRHDLNYENAKQRLRKWADDWDEELQSQFFEYLDQEDRSWDSFLRFIQSHDLTVPEWDLVTFCVHRRTWL